MSGHGPRLVVSTIEDGLAELACNRPGPCHGCFDRQRKSRSGCFDTGRPAKVQRRGTGQPALLGGCTGVPGPGQLMEQSDVGFAPDVRFGGCGVRSMQISMRNELIAMQIRLKFLFGGEWKINYKEAD